MNGFVGGGGGGKGEKNSVSLWKILTGEKNATVHSLKPVLHIDFETQSGVAEAKCISVDCVYF